MVLEYLNTRLNEEERTEGAYICILSRKTHSRDPRSEVHAFRSFRVPCGLRRAVTATKTFAVHGASCLLPSASYLTTHASLYIPDHDLSVFES